MPDMDKIAATLGGALLAMDFVTEPETWPVFAAWVRRNSSPAAAATFGDDMRDKMIVTMGNLDWAFKLAQQRAGQGIP